MAQPPTGAVTFLFTDIVGSTGLWERHGDMMGAAVAEHDAVLRSAVADNHGYIFATGGDSVAAAFQSPVEAIMAAVAAQRRLALTDAAPAGELPLQVRMGLHTGVAEERDGDYFGPAVNRCARLMSIAHGGQVLVSLATAEVAHDQLPAEVELVELGVHRLPGVGRPERIHQLRHPDLPDEFPDLSVAGAGAPLPFLASAFVGRSGELAALHDLLQHHRLVTLVGPGGVGKTRLALEAARRGADAYPDGVWFGDLSELRDLELVGQHVASLLGVGAAHGRPVLDRLVGHLSGRRLLLVLDNCEQVRGAVAQLAGRVIQGTTGPVVLATSRAPLLTEGEQVLRLSPLPADGEGSGAVELFLDRAGGLANLPAGSLPDIVELCRRLDGLPLAIELAASRAPVLHPRDILARMTRGAPLLSDAAGRQGDRHRTIDAAIAWSYDLLSPGAQRVLERLSVFVGGFNVDDAEVVVADDAIAREEVVDLLLELHRNSLVRAASDPTGSRVELLETIREFAAAKLEARGGAREVRRRHADHAVTVAARATERIRSGDEQGWLDLLTRQHGNLQAAIAWNIAEQRWSPAASIIAALASFWAWHHPAVGHHWSGRFLDGSEAPSEARVTVLAIAARFAWLRGDQTAARALAENAIEESRAAGVEAPSWSTGVHALCELFDGDPEGRAVTLALEAVQTARTGGDPLELVLHLPAAAMSHGFTGRPEDGIPYAEEAVVTARATGVDRAIVEAEAVLGSVLALCRSDGARAILDRVLPRTVELQMPWVRATSSLFRGVAILIHEKPQDAVPAFVTAVESAAEVHDLRALFGAAELVVGLARRLGRTESAARLLGAVIHGRERTGDLRGAPTELRAREREEAALRDALGPRFEQLVAAEQHRSTEDLARLTLEILRELETA